MSFEENKNKLKKQHAPGLWEDMNGHMHFSITDAMKFFEVEDTPKNHEAVKNIIIDVMKRVNPNAPIIFRNNPDDKGEDLR